MMQSRRNRLFCSPYGEAKKDPAEAGLVWLGFAQLSVFVVNGALVVWIVPA